MLLIPVISERYASDSAIERFSRLDSDFLVLLVIDKDKTDAFLSIGDYMWKGKQFAEKIAQNLGGKVITEWGNTAKKILYFLNFGKADKVAFIKDISSRPIIKEIEKEFPDKIVFV